MNRPNSTFHGMNPRERESKLANLRIPPLGPRSTVDPSIFERPVGQAYRKEERSVLNDSVATEAPALCAGLRVRVEPNSRDAMNARILEQMPVTAARNITPNDILLANKPLVQETNPIDSRRGVNSYKQAIEFFPDANTTTGVQPKMKQVERFMQNPFLQRLDAQNEPRQIARELRSAVTEDNREKYLDLSQKIANRNFSSVLVQEAEEEKIVSLTAYELLKPKLDDFSQQYRKF